MTLKKTFIFIVSACIGIPVVVMLLLGFIALRSSHYALIQDANNSYFTAKNLIIIGDIAAFRKGAVSYQNRNQAFANSKEPYSFTLSSLQNIKKIELFVQPEEEYASSTVSAKYLGLYKVNVIGHTGFLYLGAKNNSLYGTIRFPNWGRGTYEYLKGVRVQNGQLFFIRSATTQKEVLRLGASTYFTQRYFGTYNASGTMISGYFYNDRGDKNIWDANR